MGIENLHIRYNFIYMMTFSKYLDSFYSIDNLWYIGTVVK